MNAASHFNGSSWIRWIGTAATSLLAAAISMQLASFGLSGVVYFAIVGLGFAGGLVSSLSCHSPSGRQRVLIGLLVCLAASFILSPSAVIGAWADVANGFIVAWDVMFEGYVLPFRTPEYANIQSMASIALCFAAMASLVVWVILRLRKSAFVLGLCVAVAVLGIFAGKATFASLGLLMGSGVLLAALMAMGRKQKGETVLQSHQKIGPVLSPLVFVVVLTLFAAFSVAGIFGNWEDASRLRTNALQAWDEFRFGSDTLPEGDFAQAFKLNQEDPGDPIDRLEASFPSSEDVEASYFRGYVGTAYVGSSFSRPSVSVYDGQWNGLFDWLEAGGFDPLIQNALYAQIDYGEARRQTPSSSIKIDVEQANRRYSYTPYQALRDPSAVPLLDLGLQPVGFFGSSEATVEIILGSQASELFSPTKWVLSSNGGGTQGESEFLQAERAYRSFVYDAYLKGWEGNEDIIRNFFFSGKGWRSDTDDLYSIATRIRSMLESHCTYSDDPAPYSASSGSDYVGWFLEDERQGNATAFAAAATLAFREAGVPARYVEGYLLNQANADALKEAGQATVQLTSREAHAWVEVYIDGVGWTPLEMTPGFYEKDYAAEQTIEISKEVAGDGSDSELSGSLDRSWDDWIPEELRPFAWIGLVLLFAIIALMIYGTAELQRFCRIRKRRKRINDALGQIDDRGSRPIDLTALGSIGASMPLFDRLAKALRFAPIPFDESRPGGYEAAIAKWDAGIRPDEYRRVVQLMERERFGAVPLNAHEVFLVEDILGRLEQSLWKKASRRNRLIMRYAYLFDLPLVSGETDVSSGDRINADAR